MTTTNDPAPVRPDHPPFGDATVLGYPRLGRHRELKRVIEAHWAEDATADDVRDVARQVRSATWHRLRDLGVDAVPSNVASLYDHLLDTAVLVDVVPERFRHLRGGDTDGQALRFAMARGTTDLAPLELTKWFDTNYHVLVPEVDADTPFALADDGPLRELREATALGIATRPVLVGPYTFLALAKPADGAPGGFRPLDRLPELVAVYAELLGALAGEGAAWVQLDEPALVTDLDGGELGAVASAYATLTAAAERPAVHVSLPYGRPGAALPALVGTGVEAVGIDLTATDDDTLLATDLAGTTLVAGIVDGRNVWRADLDRALERLERLVPHVRALAVSTSCSLLHVPHDVDDEHELDPRVRSWLAFADQKAAEVVTLATALRDGPESVGGDLASAREVVAARRDTPWIRDEAVRSRLDALPADATTRTPAPERRALQRDALDLPPLPTTTIGSFPQTAEVRAARAAHRAGTLDDDGYRRAMRDEVARVVALQEEIGLDVVVHGEPERDDMVRYFADQLGGFATTQHGWVQSYGTRAVRPPILYGDVVRAAPMTVEWFEHAQGLTDRPVKGMLTGPVTILAWSFVRDDQPLADTARQLALAIRDETVDLEAAGARIVQVDEPALRELLPLRAADQADYLDWSVAAFRLATAGVADTTQVHTHLCYSEFGDVIGAIDALDADVTSLEAARSRMEVLDDLVAIGFARDVGPGVYDIHSPRVPDEDEVRDLLGTALRAMPAGRLWVNPDCGLKTRGYAEVEPALRTLVAAATALRASG